MKKENNEQLKLQLKLQIAEFIGELKSKQFKINGESGQVIIGAFSLIEFLRKIMKIL